jgi:hypothetical protein
VCFSADASLVAGTLLLPAGAYCVTVALKKDRSYLPLAATPLFFSAQQFCEAGVWIGLENHDAALVKVTSIAYLFFAIAFWPFWIPLATAVLEPRRGRRWLFFALSGAGLLVGGACELAIALHYDEWLTVGIDGHSIRYDLSRIPLAQAITGVAWQVLYLSLVCVPLLMSTERRLRALGISVAVAAVVAHLAFWYVFASVWCFFAAMLSLQIGNVLYRLPGETPDPALRPTT